MKTIDYTSIIPNSVGPRLAYHGFKYDEAQSYPPQYQYSFSRTYWCKRQSVSIAPVEYDVEDIAAVKSQNHDFPTEVPRELLRIQEPEFRLWLSNKYILGVLESEPRCVNLLPGQGIDTEPFDAEEIMNSVKTNPSLQPGQRLPMWWEFHSEDDLRRVLDEMVQIILTDGLDWFEQQIADVRRYHEKLDRRRLASRKESRLT